MAISDDTVRYVAKLAGIAVTASEAKKLESELNEILRYVERLGEVDTTGVRETSHVHGEINFFREDLVQESLSQEQVKAMAPDFSSGGYRVPKIIN